jgi:undecaprenyl pyrophosphate phosphatase UppP
MATSEALERARRAEQLRGHRGAVRGSITSAALLGPLLVALLWADTDSTHLLAWLAGLAVLVSGRAVVGIWHRRSAPDPARDEAWLLRYRLSFALHALAWAAVALRMLPGVARAGRTISTAIGTTWFCQCERRLSHVIFVRSLYRVNSASDFHPNPPPFPI